MTNLIGLHGKAGSGKDTAYELLSGYLDVRVKRDAFADRLKLSAIRNFKPDCTLEEAYEFCERLKSSGEISVIFDDEHVAYSVTGRQFLQHYGTEAHRQVFADDFWVDAVLPDRYDSQRGFGREDANDWDLLVITDVRFPNEAAAVRAAGGEVWQIVRPELDVGPQDAHLSEVPLNGSYVDRIILNSGTIEYFEDQLLSAWNESVLYV